MPSAGCKIANSLCCCFLLPVQMIAPFTSSMRSSFAASQPVTRSHKSTIVMASDDPIGAPNSPTAIHSHQDGREDFLAQPAANAFAGVLHAKAEEEKSDSEACQRS